MTLGVLHLYQEDLTNKPVEDDALACKCCLRLWQRNITAAINCNFLPVFLSEIKNDLAYITGNQITRCNKHN
jgi:hypothetical protein